MSTTEPAISGSGPIKPERNGQATVFDTRVHLLGGRILHGTMLGAYHPGRDFCLRLYDRSEEAVSDDAVRLVIRRLKHPHPVTGGTDPGFELRVAEDASISGQLHSAKALSSGLLLHATVESTPASLYVPYASFAALSVAPLPCASDVAMPTAGEATRDVIVLRSFAQVKLYLEVLQGTQPPQESLATLRNAAAQPADDSDADLRPLSARLGVPLVDLGRLPMPPPAGDALPVPILRRFGAIPLVATQDLLAIATSDPANQELTTALEFLTPKRVVPLLASARAIQAGLSQSYDRIEDEALLHTLGLHTGSNDPESAEREAERLSREKPVVKLVSDIISAAVQRRASDIHIRPGSQDVELLYRIDGELVPVRRFLRELLPALISRIKVLGSMNLADHRVPQDGRVSVAEAGESIDLRISMLPTVHGESAVLRLLNTRESLRRMGDIGLTASDEQALRDLLGRSHGMILATGPTGCGKSTTLYAALLELSKQNLNIITVEDPVEYRIPQIEQIQVNRAAGTTFARSLRNILRHDPDVIMVGEIRDRETAEIAVESALTGHVLLSTLHTNSAATSITRLLDLGVEAFLLRSTLLGVIAQRLARRICPHCRVVDKVAQHVREVMGVEADELFHIGAGCAACDGTGVHGRIAVYELLKVDATLRELIQPKTNADAIHTAAQQQGMRSITAHALSLARAGVISLGEAFRIRVE